MTENTEETTESTRSPLPETAQLPASTKSSKQAEADRAEHIKIAYQAADRILRFYRRTDAWDPDVFLAGIAANLANYPRDVIEEVADPSKGIVSTCKFPPQPAEIKEMCEAIMAPRRRMERREASIKAQLEERERLAAPPEPRQTWPEVVEEMAARGFGVAKGHNETPASVRAKAGLTQEEWDKIPNQPPPEYWRGVRQCAPIGDTARPEMSSEASNGDTTRPQATAEGADHG